MNTAQRLDDYTRCLDRIEDVLFKYEITSTDPAIRRLIAEIQAHIAQLDDEWEREQHA